MAEEGFAQDKPAEYALIGEADREALNERCGLSQLAIRNGLSWGQIVNCVANCHKHMASASNRKFTEFAADSLREVLFKLEGGKQ
jgi:hypothetical protein